MILAAHLCLLRGLPAASALGCTQQRQAPVVTAARPFVLQQGLKPCHLMLRLLWLSRLLQPNCILQAAHLGLLQHGLHRLHLLLCLLPFTFSLVKLPLQVLCQVGSLLNLLLEALHFKK